MGKSFPVTFNFKAFESVSKVTDKLGKRFDKLKSKTTQINNRFQMAQKKTEMFGKRMKNLGGKISNVGKKMTAFVTLPILAAGTAFTKAAADAEETRTKFNEVFKDIDEGTRQQAFKRLGSDFKLANSSAQEFLGTTGLILQGLDLNQKASLEYSEELVGLAQDVASFRNVQGGAEQVVRAFTGALTGERERLKTLGIVINEADVKAEALRLSQEGVTFETVKQAKALATLSLIKKRTAKDAGDFARTQDSLANQTRIAQENFKKFSETIGKILIPVGQKIVKIFNRLTEGFLKLSPATQKLIVIGAGLVAALGPLLVLFGGFLAILPAIVTGFSFIGVAGLILAAKFVAIGLAIAALVAGIMWLIDNWSTLVDWIKQVVIPAILDLVKKFGFLLGPVGLFAQAGLLIIDNWSGIKKFFVDTFDAVINAAKPLLDILNTIIAGPAKIAARFGSKVAKFFGFGKGQEKAQGPGAKIGRTGLSESAQIGRSIAQEIRTTNDARVRVDFANAPKGTRVRSSQSTGIPPELNLGFSGGML